MSEMAERIAKAQCALAVKNGYGRVWEDLTPELRDGALALAAVAIEEMRKPTQAMMDAPTSYDGPCSQFSPSDSQEVGEQMIDEALK